MWKTWNKKIILKFSPILIVLLLLFIFSTLNLIAPFFFFPSPSQTSSSISSSFLLLLKPHWPFLSLSFFRLNRIASFFFFSSSAQTSSSFLASFSKPHCYRKISRFPSHRNIIFISLFHFLIFMCNLVLINLGFQINCSFALVFSLTNDTFCIFFVICKKKIMLLWQEWVCVIFNGFLLGFFIRLFVSKPHLCLLWNFSLSNS